MTPDARPIVKGKLAKRTEFGYLAQVVDNRDGIVVDHSVHVGNPPDAPLLAPAIRRVKARFGRAPLRVTADRQYGEASVEADLEDVGVTTVAILRKGRPGKARQAVERSPRFRRLIKWRTGSEGRIAQLKHNFCWDRTLLDGIDGAQIWCGFGILASNTVKIAQLIDQRDRRRATRRPQRQPEPTGADPPRAGPPPDTHAA